MAQLFLKFCVVCVLFAHMTWSRGIPGGGFSHVVRSRDLETETEEEATYLVRSAQDGIARFSGRKHQERDFVSHGKYISIQVGRLESGATYTVPQTYFSFIKLCNVTINKGPNYGTDSIEPTST